MAFFSKFKDALTKTRESLGDKLNSLVGAFKSVDEEFFEELEELLILSDTGTDSAAALCEAVKKRVKKENISEPEKIKELLKEEIERILSEKSSEIDLSSAPSVIIVLGVNGVGKTTTIGKLAAKYKKEGKKVLLAAADTFRAAASEQLSIWADRAGVPIVKHSEGADPAAVLFDAISSAKAKNMDIVICDTAGRLHNKKPLMEELSKIYRVIEKASPESSKETLLVIDATTGQNGVVQVKEFSSAVPLSGIILTKLDGTAKGGIVIPICRDYSLPVKFVGLGEKEEDLEKFDPKLFSEGLLGE
jgi:fused signal recognition particle receptor